MVTFFRRLVLIVVQSEDGLRLEKGVVEEVVRGDTGGGSGSVLGGGGSMVGGGGASIISGDGLVDDVGAVGISLSAVVSGVVVVCASSIGVLVSGGGGGVI